MKTKTIQPVAKSKTRKSVKPLLGSIAALLALGVGSATSKAATFTYDDGSLFTFNWSDAANWNPDGAPVNGSDLVFSVQVAGGSAINDSLTSVQSITFGGQVFNLSGNAFTLGSGGITNNSALTQTLSFGGTGMTLGASQAWTANGGALSVTSNVVLGGFTLTVGGANNTEISGTITGTTGGVTKTGAGTLTLSGGASVFTGAFNVNDGTVLLNQFAFNSATGQGALIIGDGVGGAGSAVVRNLLSDEINNTSAVTVNADGRLDLNNFGETVGSIAGSGQVTLGTAFLTTGGDNSSTTFSGTITGTTGGMTKNGTGTWTLNGGASVFTGAFTVNDGTVELNQLALNSATGQGDLIIGDNVGAAGSAVVRLLISQEINNTSAVTINADGRLDLNSHFEDVGSIAGLAGSSITLGTANLTSGGNNSSTTFSGNITGTTGSVTKTGTGTWLLNGAGSNTFSGAFTVNDGTVQLDMGGAEATGQGNLIIGNNVGAAGSAVVQLLQGAEINNNVAVTINTDGLLDVGAFTETVGSIAGTGQLAMGTGAVTTGGNNTSTTFSGSIIGAGTLTKQGTGVWTLTGPNTYSGQTIVANGILEAGSNSALGLGGPGNGTTVNDGATLRVLANVNLLTEPLTLNGNGFGGIGALVINGPGSTIIGGPVVLGGAPGSTTTIIAGAGTTITFAGGIDKDAQTLVFQGLGGGTFNVNTVGISGATSFTSDFVVNGGVTNFAVANAYAGPTWIGNGGTLNANVLGALPSPAADGGIAAIRTLVVMDPDTLANFPGAPAAIVPPGSVAPSTLNLNANQAIQSLASANTVGIGQSSFVNLNNNTLTIGTINLVPPPATFFGVIGGGPLGGLTKDGTSTQILGGNNTYIGPTWVQAGHLQIGVGGVAGTAGNLAGASAVTVNPAAFLDLNLANTATFANNVLNNGTVQGINTAGNTQTVSGVITGIGNFLQNAGGTTIFTNVNTYQGGTGISAASTLQVGNLAQAGSVGSGAVSVSGGSFLTLVNVSGGVLANNVSNNVGGAGTIISTPAFASTTTLSGALTDTLPATLALTHNGFGTTLLTNAGNTYNGGTAVTIGNLQIGAVGFASSAGANTAANAIDIGNGGTVTLVNLNADPLNNNFTNTLGGTGLVRANSANNITLAGSLTSGAGNFMALTQSGPATTTLTNAANNINGPTVVSAGSLAIGTAALASRLDAAQAAAVSVGSGGTLTLVNLVGNTFNNSVTNTLGGAGLVNVNSANTNTLGGVLSNGIGTLALTNTAGTTILTGANTYTGATTVLGGILQIGDGATGNLNVGSAVTVNPAAFLDLNLVNGGTFANNVLNNGTVRGINAAATAQTVSGVISGLGAFAQTGAGTTIFTNTNTYAGGTSVSAGGTVQVGTAALAGSLGSGLVSVSGGSSLNLVNLTGNAFANSVSNVIAGVGTVNINSVNTNTLSGAFTDGGGFTLTLAQNGTGTTIMTNAANAYNGGTRVTGGVLQIGTAALASTLGNNILANTVAVGTGGTLTIVNLAGGSNPLLNAIDNNTGGVGTVNVNSVGTVTLGGPLTNTAGTLALVQSNLLGTTILTNAGNTYGGGTTVSAGVLQVGTAALASSLGANLAGNTVSVGNGATLSIVNLAAAANPLLNNITNNLAGTGLVNVNSVNANTLGGILSNGAGILALTQTGLGTTTLTGANIYTGATTVAGGTLQIGDGAMGSISGSSPVTVNGAGTLDINLLTGSTFANTVLNNGAMRGINGAGTTQTYSGVISGLGSFSQIGGTGIFTNVNTYAGGTTINGPTTTLQIGTPVSAAAAGSGNININGGSTLALVNVSGNLLSNNMTNTVGGLAGTVLVNSALTTTISGSITDGAGGPLQLTHNGTGTTILTNTGNTYTGLTTINSGILQVGTAAQAGSIGGGTPIKIGAGAALSIVNLGNPGTLSNTVIQNSLGGIGTLNVNSALTNTITSQLIDGGLGTLALTQTGTGTTILANVPANTYSGLTTITAGALQIGNGGAAGSLGTGLVTNNALLAFNVSGPLLVTNNISGTGNLTQIGAGTTSLTGTNTYTGTTLISAGALSVGNGGAAGSLGVGAVTNNASLIFNRSDAHTVANGISGFGSVTQQGTGITTLTGASTYTGTTTVAAGTLQVNGSLGNTAVTVQNLATLSGTGSIAGTVTVQAGGIFAPGTSPGTITVGSLVLNAGSNSNFELGVPGVIGQAVLPGNDLVNVTGNLTIDGTLNVTQIAGYGAGSYRLFNYGGVLTNNIFDAIIGAGPNATIVTGVAGQVNLLVLNAGVGPVQFWDGAGVPNDAVIAGGNGNWDNFQTNWTNAAGTVNAAWQNGTASFGGAAGTVTLTNPINAQGLAFTTTGYVINGGGFTLNLVGPAPAPTITVSGGLSATINAQITGINGLTADGAGTLFLTNVGNSYTGGTTINGGTVSVANDGSLGAAGGIVTLNAGTLQATATFASARGITLAGAGTIDVTGVSTFTESGIITGAGALSKTGTGSLILSGVNTYVGGTNILGGVLAVSNDNNLGNVVGGVNFSNNATLETLAGITSGRAVSLNAGGGTVDTNGFTSTLSGIIGGAAGNHLTKVDTGTLIATGASTYLGQTHINGGTLQVGDGATVGSQIGNNTAVVNVNNGGALAVNLANGGTFGNAVTVNAGGVVNAIGGNPVNSQTISGVISGAGVFNQNSAGTTILTGVNTHTGATNVNTGTLQVGNALTGNLSAGTQVNVAVGATLAANLGNGQTLASAIVNAGTLNAINGAGITQTLSGVISGGGTFNQTAAGTTILTGASTYTGATNVGGTGTLLVNGSLGNTAVTVQNGATLGGVGNIAGNVTVLAGGILAAGTSPGTITVGSLVLNAGSNSNFELNTPGIIGSGINDLVNVTGNMTLDGTLNLTAVAPPFGSGSYRLYNYGGVLTNNILDVNLATVPAGFTATVVTGVLHEVNLLVLANGVGPAQFWDGAGLPNDGIIAGGTGNWDNFQNNWTNAVGNPNAAWQNGTANFGGAAGTVTIVAPINAQNLIFTTSGYVINGSGGWGLNLVGPAPAPTINVLGGGIATINAQITGANGLTSNGAGTLVLTNVGNTYSGGTTITGGGTVSISDNANLGDLAGGVTFNAGTLQATQTFATNRAMTLTGAGTLDVTFLHTLTANGVISGAGSLTKTNTGILNLTALNTYAGGTNILGGTVQVSNDNNLGNIAGGLTFANNATLQTLAGITSARAVTLNAGGGTIDTNGFNSTLSGVIGGVGSLTKINAGTLILTGVGTYTGATNINGGTLQVGNGATGNLAAASVVNVNNVGTLALNLANGDTFANSVVTSLGGLVTGINGGGSTQTLSGVISGAGALNQNGAGTTILTAANTYTGTTSVLQGTLQIGNGTTGSISVASAVSTAAGSTLALHLANGGVFANNVSNAGAVHGLVNGANVNTISGIISGVGVLNQIGTGTTILTGANSYSGATTVNAGTLQIGNGFIGSINPVSPVTVDPGATLAVNLVTGGTLGNNILDNGSVNAIQAGINNLIGVISGSGVVNQNGTGTTNVSGANTYTGLTTLNAGVLEVQHNTALGTIAAGTVVNAGAALRLASGITVGAEALTINGAGTGAANAQGALTVVAGGTATYNGPILVASASTIHANGGTLNLNGAINKSDNILTLTGGGTINVNGAITGDNDGVFNDDLVVAGVTTNLNFANTFEGPTTVTSIVAGDGVLNANVPNAMPTINGRSAVTMDNAGAGGSTFNIGGSAGFPLGASQAIASLVGAGSSNVTLGGNTLTIGFGSGVNTGGVAGANFAGVIDGTGNIVKDDTSTQIFSGINTYTGTTTVNGGTLQAGSTQAFGVDSPTTVNANAILELAGHDNTLGSLSGGGVNSFVQNNMGGAATLTLSGAAGASSAYSGVIRDTVGNPLSLVIDDINGFGAAQSLSGQSTYTGGTTLVAGTLNIDASSQAAGAVPPASGPLGTGLLTIKGGTIGTTSATGGTVDRNIGNAVQIDSDFNVSSSDGANLVGGPVIADGVTFNGPVNLGTTATINTTSGYLNLTGVVSGGTAGLTFTGNTFSLIGAGGAGDAPNTYTGLTTVSGGLVLLNKGASVPGAHGLAIAGNVQVDSGALLQVNSNFLTGGGTANNQIAPTANALVNGTLDIGGTNQTLNNLSGSGVVELSDAAVNAAFGGGAPGTTAGVLAVNSGVFNGSIRASGFGGALLKNSAGTLVLNGINTYTGPTIVNNGSLYVNGSIASAHTTVNPLGLLGGVGVIGGNLFNHGVVSPGNSVAILTIKGNYVQTASGRLDIEVAGRNQGSVDALAVGGSAYLDGGLRIQNVGNVKLKRGDKLTLLAAAGGVNGEFSNVSNPFSTGKILSGEVVYHSTSVVLEMVQGSFADFASIHCNPNAVAVGKALDNVAYDSNQAKLINYLNNQDLGDLCNDFNLIAPDEFQAIYTIGISQANVQTANLSRRMDDIRSGAAGFSAAGLSVSGMMPQYSGNYLLPNSGVAGPEGKYGKEIKEMRPPAENRTGLFLTGFGEFSNLGQTYNASGYDLSAAGFTLGLDYRVSEHLAVGINAGYSRSKADLYGHGNINVDGLRLGLYATYFNSGFYVDGSLQGGYNTYDTRRTALQGTATGSTDGTDFNALLAVGYDWRRGGLSVGPLASVQYTRVGFDSFRENGSLAPLTYDSQSGESLRTALGAKASYEFHAGSVVIKPELRLAWQHEFGDSAYGIQSNFANGGNGAFTVHGAEIGSDSLLIGAGVAVLWNERTSTYVYYDGEVGRTNYSSNNVSAGVRLQF